MIVKYDGKVVADFEGRLAPEEIRTAISGNYPAVISAGYVMEDNDNTINFYTKSGKLG